ncbi:hypothetical protein BLS_008028 [Venturia inaequalis]|uniref:Protein transport protein SEC22 n=1 Tax=Venturia inaequalis TaxID=5025 RepID=A0A8H3Z545_VENIN|nr:hypothetical protein EG328_004260 [Venturia inaequalis]KAE9980967.1 hypothetical protein BLS_008028 [Venturia inaequalis]KAE9989866.1 hypothetical protein EG327_002168 [Venturia inaequalis]
MIRSTQIVRLDGLILCGSVDDEQAETALVDIKAKVKKLIRMFSQNSANEASIESDQYTIHYIVKDSVIFLCICDQSYPRKVAFTYLSDISSEFTSVYPSGQYLSTTAKSYGYIEFDTYIQKAKRSYQDTRATQNLDKLNYELKDVTKVMTKNIEELLYRGDSLDKMGEMSGRLREDSRKYKKAAVRINWQILLSKVSGVFLISTLFWGVVICLAFYLVGATVPIGAVEFVFYAYLASNTIFIATAIVALMALFFITSLCFLIVCLWLFEQIVVATPFILTGLPREPMVGSFSQKWLQYSEDVRLPLVHARECAGVWAEEFINIFIRLEEVELHLL